MGEIKGDADIFDTDSRLQAAMKQPVQYPGIATLAVAAKQATPGATTTGSPCAEVRVFWPPELADLLHPFRRFVEAMTYKLRKNAGKKSYDEADLPQLFELLRGEIDELEQAVAEGNSIETLLEASDAANFCMLIASVAMKRGIK